jgi:aminoglycoside phosphotransferase family enzyme/predicted kinase
MAVTAREKGWLPPVIEAMLKPEFYPHLAADIELKQTHTSYVLLAGEFAYKVRKAVRFAFIDCSTAARRRALCEREIELNRRLSPDIYLAVVGIVQIDGRIILNQGAHDSASAIEFAVKMRRLPEDRRLDLVIKRDAATPDNIREIANTIANFHAATQNTNSWAYGAAASIWRMTIGNLLEIEQLGPGAPLLRKIAEIEDYSRRYIAVHWELLNSRAHEGRVHEGHGDLRADAVYLTSDGIRIVDCLEFDERLRYGDIANEVAFLAMDLERLGRPDLSDELAAYFIGDPDMALLMPFYKSYRATVRAKVELLRSRQEDSTAQDKETAVDSAVHLLDLALSYAHGPNALLIVCGASGTGKSTLAAMLSEHLACDIVSSDVMRKRLAGIQPNTSAAARYNQGIYTPEFTSRVYASILAEANRVLNMGKGVILDATFGKRIERQLAVETAKQAGVKPLFLECRAHKDLVIQRLSERGQDSQRISDATVEIYLTQIKEFEPLDEIPPAWHQVVDTTHDLGSVVIEVERKVATRLGSLLGGRRQTD